MTRTVTIPHRWTDPIGWKDTRSRRVDWMEVARDRKHERLETEQVCRSVQYVLSNWVFICPLPPPHTHIHTLSCGSQYNLSSSVCVALGMMAMQNEFVPVAVCVLRTLGHCITVTVLMFTQFCALTAAYHTHPIQSRFLFCSNKLFVSSAVHRSHLTWILYKWCSKLSNDPTENTLYCITKKNRLVLFRGKFLLMMWIIQMRNNNVCAKMRTFWSRWCMCS
jgi:hypothetical protein